VIFVFSWQIVRDDRLSRERFLIWACIVLVTALSWSYLVHLDRQMASSMAHDRKMAEMAMTMDMPRSAMDPFFTFAMCAVMMVGMMAGSARSAWGWRAAPTASAAAGR